MPPTIGVGSGRTRRDFAMANAEIATKTTTATIITIVFMRARGCLTDPKLTQLETARDSVAYLRPSKLRLQVRCSAFGLRLHTFSNLVWLLDGHRTGKEQLRDLDPSRAPQL